MPQTLLWSLWLIKAPCNHIPAASHDTGPSQSQTYSAAGSPCPSPAGPQEHPQLSHFGSDLGSFRGLRWKLEGVCSWQRPHSEEQDGNGQMCPHVLNASQPSWMCYIPLASPSSPALPSLLLCPQRCAAVSIQEKVGKLLSWPNVHHTESHSINLIKYFSNQNIRFWAGSFWLNHNSFNLKEKSLEKPSVLFK